jgi:hypothetical protein
MGRDNGRQRQKEKEKERHRHRVRDRERQRGCCWLLLADFVGVAAAVANLRALGLDAPTLGVHLVHLFVSVCVCVCVCVWVGEHVRRA